MKLTEWFKKIRNKKKTEDAKEPEIIEKKESLVTVIKEEKPEQEQAGISFQKLKVRMEDKEERTRYVRNCCEQMLEASNETENAKLEYNLITAYLNDMQLIEELEGDSKKVVHGIVHKIQCLLDF